MIEEIGTITAVDSDHIWVETEIKSTCGACVAKDNCGTGVVAKAFAPKKELLVLRCTKKAIVGQQVRLGIPENHLLSASALVYLLPLVVLVVSAVSGQWLLSQLSISSELWIIGFSALCTFFCFKWVKHKLDGENAHRYQPRLLALIPEKASQINIQSLSPDS